jgi:2-methylisocitrate lyase-like PEP mutase family enzyme
MRRMLSTYARRSAPGAGARRLRELIAAPEICVLPGAYDCFSARLIQHEGFGACFITGQGLSGSLIGRPDYARRPRAEHANFTRCSLTACELKV